MDRPDGAGSLWLLPGGGIEPDEKNVDALRREVWEETGFTVSCTPRLLWRRIHTFGRNLTDGRGLTKQYEDIYLVLADRFEPTAGNNPEPSEVGIFHEFRWWSVAELQATSDLFAPRALPSLVAGLIANGPPPQLAVLGE